MTKSKITVAELIEQLAKFPGTARVVVDGYEGGVDDIAPPVLIGITLGVGCGVYGCHQEAEPRRTYDQHHGWKEEPAVVDEMAVHIMPHKDHRNE